MQKKNTVNTKTHKPNKKDKNCNRKNSQIHSRMENPHLLIV